MTAAITRGKDVGGAAGAGNDGSFASKGQSAAEVELGPVAASPAERLLSLRGRTLTDNDSYLSYETELLEAATEAFRAGDRTTLVQMFEDNHPSNPALAIGDVLRNIDSIARDVRHPEWPDTAQADQAVVKEIRKVMKKYWIPQRGKVADAAHAYAVANYRAGR